MICSDSVLLVNIGLFSFCTAFASEAVKKNNGCEKMLQVVALTKKRAIPKDRVPPKGVQKKDSKIEKSCQKVHGWNFFITLART